MSLRTMFSRTSTEARHKGRQRIAEDAAETLIARLGSAHNKYPVAMYTLSARQCKLITPINKRDPENRRRLADPDTVIAIRIEELLTRVRAQLRYAGITAHCEEMHDIGSRPTGERSQLLNCQITVVRTDVHV